MFSLPGILSQKKNVLSGYISTVRADNPLIFIVVQGGAAVPYDNFSYSPGYPSISGDAVSYGGSIVTGLAQSLVNDNDNTYSNSGSTFRVHPTNSIATSMKDTGSMEMWYRFNTRGSNTILPLNIYDNIRIFISPGTVHTVLQQGITLSPTSFTYLFRVNITYHLVMTWGAGVLKVYVNNLLLLNASMTGTAAGMTAGIFYFGSSRVATGQSAGRGSKQAMALYSNVLPASAVTSHYSAGGGKVLNYPTFANDTLLYIRGNSLTDSSNNSRTIIGHTHAENAITIDTTDSIYGSNGSMLFPFVTTSYQKYSARVNDFAFKTESWTIEYWFKNMRNNSVLSDTLCFLPNNFDGTSYSGAPSIYGTGSGGGAATTYAETGGLTRNITGLTYNVWKHIAITRQPEHILNIFLDGTRIFTLAHPNDLSNFNTLLLGAKALGSAVAPAQNYFKMAHFHMASGCYYTSNFTANKATGFS
jgi:hypothetical protein